ncbi:MAG: formate dehydrogenase [Casimicrobiaceae bacterium]
MKTIRVLFGAALVVASFGLAVAKLPPAAPLTDAQKAAAEEAKAKAAVAAEAGKQLQARAEDRVAAQYYADMKAKGKQVAPPYVVPNMAGTDAAKGLPAAPEKASAHSPAKK